MFHYVSPKKTPPKTSIAILNLETAWYSSWKRWHTGSWNHTFGLQKAYLIISLQGEFLINPSDPVSSNKRRINGEYKPSSSCCRWRLMIGAKVSCGSTKINSCVIPNSLEDLGSLSAICLGTLRNLISFLHRNTRNLISHLPVPSSTTSAICTGTLRNLVCYLHRNLINYLPRNSPEPHQLSAPEPSEPHQPSLQNLISHLHRNPPEHCLLSAPEPSATSSTICPGILRNLISYRNLISFLRRNPLEPHQPVAPEPSRTSPAICPGTFRNLISHLHRNPPEPCLLSAPEPSTTSSAISTGTFRNLISLLLHRKAPEPSGTFSGTWCCSCTGSHQSYSGLKTP